MKCLAMTTYHPFIADFYCITVPGILRFYVFFTDDELSLFETFKIKIDFKETLLQTKITSINSGNTLEVKGTLFSNASIFFH